MSRPARSTRTARERVIPGEAGVWHVVVLDVLVFVVLFGVFLHYRGQQPELFAASQARLTPSFGFVDTVLLLSSSLAMVAGVNATRLGRSADAGRAILLAAGLGALFVVSKIVEWTIKAHDGLVPDTDDFFQFYYVFTALHLLHVVVGIGLLLVVRRIARRGADGPHDRAYVESAAVYWHMVDLLWLILFPLVFFVH